MPPPFNINETSPAPSALISAFPADEQANRAEIEEWLSFISDPATGLIRESVLPPAGAAEIPSGTKLAGFVQTAAPTGWVKDVTHNNKALRIVNGTVGTGGTTSFTSVFASRTPAGTIGNTTSTGTNSSTSVTGTTDATTQTGSIGNSTSTGTVGGTAITTANLPSHTHGVTVSGTTSTNGAHVHSITRASVTGTAGQAVYSDTDEVGASTGGISSSGDHNHTVTSTGTSDATGSGTTHTHSLTMNAHNHTFTGNSHTHTFTSNTHTHTITMNAHNHSFTGTAMDFAVQYVDVIICTKS